MSHSKQRQNVLPLRGAPSISYIIDVVCELSGVSRADLMGRSRVSVIVTYRHLAMALAYEITQHSSLTVGAVFERDHSSVLNGIKQTRKRCEEDPFFKILWDEIVKLKPVHKPLQEQLDEFSDRVAKNIARIREEKANKINAL